MDKKAIAEILQEMGTLLELKGANPFKARAFGTAARAVEGMMEDPAALVEAGTLTSVKGIGASIAAIITELVRTGKSTEHAELKASLPAGLLDMLRVQGLGPKRVKLLFERLHLESLEALDQAARDGKLAALEGFGPKTAANIVEGIAAVRERSKRALYPAAESVARELADSLRGMREVRRLEVAGSLRRACETIGDIDILVAARDKDRANIMKGFLAHPRVRSVIAHGTTKSSAVLDTGLSCDLRVVTEEEFPFALMYFTGSKEHNVALRSRARSRGLSLNEYGFTRVEGGKGKKAALPKGIREEQDVYRALGLAYVPPELREDRGEVERAAAGDIPNLVTFGDLHGTFHCHTTASDGIATLEEMAGAAAKLGWEYLGIADHSKSATYAGGLSARDLAKQCAAIDAWNARGGIRIFKGTECDILPDGSLDWPESVRRTLDYVVVSIHSNFKMTAEAMTKRIIRGLTQKHVTILGHPTGRLLLARDPYPVHMEEVIQAAADHGKMIEINAYPNRLDLDWRLCALAREKGVLLFINPDAHSTADLLNVRYGVNVARKGGLGPADIVNSRPRKDIIPLLTRTK